jgi:hypothetical protein
VGLLIRVAVEFGKGNSAATSSALSQQIFNTSITEIEPAVQPDGVGNDIGREAVAFVSIHEPSLSKSAI